MANLQVKNVPDAFYNRLRRRARREGRTIRDVVLEALRRELAREEFRDRLARRRPVDLGRSAASALADVRAERDRDLAP
jgi:plasmid stability protein